MSYKLEVIHPKKRYSKSATRTDSRVESLAPVVVEFGFDPQSLSIEPLAGGFMNGNYLVQDKSRKAVLRVLARGHEAAQREGALLNLVRSKGIKVPECIAVWLIGENAYSLHEFVPGITLEDYLLEGLSASEDLFFAIGSQLAKIHSITFDTDGLLDTNLQISEVFDNANEFVVGFMKHVLQKTPETKLPRDLNERFLRLIEGEWSCVKENPRNHRLTHFDFNPKNILVSRQGELLAILDWEFGMAANSLADLGNFFRFPYDYPEYAKSAFINGYKKIDPGLPDEWEKASRLLDLSAMCGFLERQENYPESFHTARTVIKETLLHFGY